MPGGNKDPLGLGLTTPNLYSGIQTEFPEASEETPALKGFSDTYELAGDQSDSAHAGRALPASLRAFDANPYRHSNTSQLPNNYPFLEHIYQSRPFAFPNNTSVVDRIILEQHYYLADGSRLDFVIPAIIQEGSPQPGEQEFTFYQVQHHELVVTLTTPDGEHVISLTPRRYGNRGTYYAFDEVSDIVLGFFTPKSYMIEGGQYVSALRAYSLTEDRVQSFQSLMQVPHPEIIATVDDETQVKTESASFTPNRLGGYDVVVPVSLGKGEQPYYVVIPTSEEGDLAGEVYFIDHPDPNQYRTTPFVIRDGENEYFVTWHGPESNEREGVRLHISQDEAEGSLVIAASLDEHTLAVLALEEDFSQDTPDKTPEILPPEPMAAARIDGTTYEVLSGIQNQDVRDDGTNLVTIRVLDDFEGVALEVTVVLEEDGDEWIWHWRDPQQPATVAVHAVLTYPSVRLTREGLLRVQAGQGDDLEVHYFQIEAFRNKEGRLDVAARAFDGLPTGYDETGQTLPSMNVLFRSDELLRDLNRVPFYSDHAYNPRLGRLGWTAVGTPKGAYNPRNSEVLVTLEQPDAFVLNQARLIYENHGQDLPQGLRNRFALAARMFAQIPSEGRFDELAPVDEIRAWVMWYQFLQNYPHLLTTDIFETWLRIWEDDYANDHNVRGFVAAFQSFHDFDLRDLTRYEHALAARVIADSEERDVTQIEYRQKFRRETHVDGPLGEITGEEYHITFIDEDDDLQVEVLIDRRLRDLVVQLETAGPAERSYRLDGSVYLPTNLIEFSDAQGGVLVAAPTYAIIAPQFMGFGRAFYIVVYKAETNLSDRPYRTVYEVRFQKAPKSNPKKPQTYYPEVRVVDYDIQPQDRVVATNALKKPQASEELKPSDKPAEPLTSQKQSFEDLFSQLSDSDQDALTKMWRSLYISDDDIKSRCVGVYLVDPEVSRESMRVALRDFGYPELASQRVLNVKTSNTGWQKAMRLATMAAEMLTAPSLSDEIKASLQYAYDISDLEKARLTILRFVVPTSAKHYSRQQLSVAVGADYFQNHYAKNLAYVLLYRRPDLYADNRDNRILHWVAIAQDENWFDEMTIEDYQKLFHRMPELFWNNPAQAVPVVKAYIRSTREGHANVRKAAFEVLAKQPDVVLNNTLEFEQAILLTQLVLDFATKKKINFVRGILNKNLRILLDRKTSQAHDVYNLGNGFIPYSQDGNHVPYNLRANFFPYGGVSVAHDYRPNGLTVLAFVQFYGSLHWSEDNLRAVMDLRKAHPFLSKDDHVAIVREVDPKRHSDNDSLWQAYSREVSDRLPAGAKPMTYVDLEGKPLTLAFEVAQPHSDDEQVMLCLFANDTSFEVYRDFAEQRELPYVVFYGAHRMERVEVIQSFLNNHYESDLAIASGVPPILILAGNYLYEQTAFMRAASRQINLSDEFFELYEQVFGAVVERGLVMDTFYDMNLDRYSDHVGDWNSSSEWSLSHWLLKIEQMQPGFSQKFLRLAQQEGWQAQDLQQALVYELSMAFVETRGYALNRNRHYVNHRQRFMAEISVESMVLTDAFRSSISEAARLEMARQEAENREARARAQSETYREMVRRASRR